MSVTKYSLSLSQMNQENKNRVNKRPQKGDARQSGEIEHSADVMIGVYRPSYYLQREIQGEEDSAKKTDLITELSRVKTLVELIVLKNRRGPLEAATVYGDLPFNVVSDTEPEHEHAGVF